MPSICKVLITGATGFIGKALATELAKLPEFNVVLASRSYGADIKNFEHREHDLLHIKKIPSLIDIDIVIHTAARVHVMDEDPQAALSQFRAANVTGTLALAEAAVRSGVRRFIYISSIKVNGEETFPGQAFSAFDDPAPLDAYGISKLEAECALLKLAADTKMEIVIIRPPLVYGPGVKANFQKMIRWAMLGIPLPFGGIKNARSLVGITNLVSLLIICINHPKASNQIFLVSDGIDVSTPMLIAKINNAMHKKSRLFSIPEKALKLILQIAGQKLATQRLCASLQVDISPTMQRLDWHPLTTLDQELLKTVEHAIETGNKKGI